MKESEKRQLVYDRRALVNKVEELMNLYQLQVYYSKGPVVYLFDDAYYYEFFRFFRSYVCQSWYSYQYEMLWLEVKVVPNSTNPYVIQDYVKRFLEVISEKYTSFYYLDWKPIVGNYEYTYHFFLVNRDISIPSFWLQMVPMRLTERCNLIFSIQNECWRIDDIWRSICGNDKGWVVVPRKNELLDFIKQSRDGIQVYNPRYFLNSINMIKRAELQKFWGLASVNEINLFGLDKNILYNLDYTRYITSYEVYEYILPAERGELDYHIITSTNNCK